MKCTMSSKERPEYFSWLTKMRREACLAGDMLISAGSFLFGILIFALL